MFQFYRDAKGGRNMTRLRTGAMPAHRNDASEPDSAWAVMVCVLVIECPSLLVPDGKDNSELGTLR